MADIGWSMSPYSEASVDSAKPDTSAGQGDYIGPAIPGTLHNKLIATPAVVDLLTIPGRAYQANVKFGYHRK